MNSRIIFVSWLAIAVAIGLSGALADGPALLAPIMVFSLTLVVVLSFHFSSKSRAFFDRIGFERILRFHLVRFIGIYFLYLYYQGKLPYEFAVLGGVGDIIVAIFALILLFYTQSRNFKQVVFVWNTVGLIDILFVISTAIRFLIEDRSQMEQLTHLPLSLLPTFVVPLIISSHYITFYLLNSQKRARQAH